MHNLVLEMAIPDLKNIFLFTDSYPIIGTGQVKLSEMFGPT